MMKRVFLFLALNLGIMLALGIIASLLGINSGVGKTIELGPLLVFSLFFGFAGAFISLLLSKPMAKWSTKAQLVNRNDPAQDFLYRQVELHAGRSGLTTPEVYIYESDEPNAFATGAFRNSAMVAVSTGLLRRMTREEVDAVLAHEVGHIANGDMVTMTLLQGVLNTFVIAIARVLGWVVDRVLLKNESDEPGMAQYVASFFFELTLGIFAAVIMAWYSRRREFAADRDAAALTSKTAMANALRRLDVESAQALPANMAAMGMRSNNKVLKLFSTHPPIQERIDALMRN